MDWRYNSLGYEKISPEKKVKWDFTLEKKSHLTLKGVEYAMLRQYRYKGISFETLPPSDELLFLNMDLANIRDFQGIEKFPSLKRLELHYCTKLESDNSLSKIRESLEWLHIHTSKKLQSLDEICELSNLKVLCLNNCGPLENLQFLKNFPKLLNFRFVDTNVLDGDLTPLIEHPTLKSANFLNKRHYNYSSDQIDLKLKVDEENKHLDYTYKDRFRDFKYKDII